MAPDVNVLVAASRLDHPHHAVAHAWLATRLAQAEHGAVLTLLPMVVASFVRVVTHPKVFAVPTPVADAWAFVRALLSAPGVVAAQCGAEWPTLEHLCVTHALAGNDIPDAAIAAAALSLGEHVVTFDRGFRRFLGRGQLTVLTP
ncbi:MAG: PIN domain-containing protein [Armatimonadetes bacterium]|nr:PIN domain-containing protein [Armatimonadota bacterium]